VIEAQSPSLVLLVGISAGVSNMKDLAGGKHSIKAVGSSPDNSLPDNALVKDWDKVTGHMQHRERITAREAMGQKMTPIGRATLRSK